MGTLMGLIVDLDTGEDGAESDKGVGGGGKVDSTDDVGVGACRDGWRKGHARSSGDKEEKRRRILFSLFSEGESLCVRMGREAQCETLLKRSWKMGWWGAAQVPYGGICDLKVGADWCVRSDISSPVVKPLRLSWLCHDYAIS